MSMYACVYLYTCLRVRNIHEAMMDDHDNARLFDSLMGCADED